MSASKRVWSAQDLAKLALCYQARVPLHLVSQYFRTSISAVSKTLSRSQIRPAYSRPRGVRPRKERSLISHYAQLLTYLEENRALWESPNSSLFKARRKKRVKGMLDIKHVQKNEDKSVGSSLVALSPVDQAKVKTKKIKTVQDLWTSMTHVVEELMENGYHIVPLENYSWNRMGYSHLLDGKPVRPGELLKILNGIRQRLNRPLVFVTELTSH